MRRLWGDEAAHLFQDGIQRLSTAKVQFVPVGETAVWGYQEGTGDNGMSDMWLLAESVRGSLSYDFHCSGCPLSELQYGSGQIQRQCVEIGVCHFLLDEVEG